MYTLVITNIDLIYFVFAMIIGYTSHRIGLRTGAERAVNYMEDNDMLKLDEKNKETE